MQALLWKITAGVLNLGNINFRRTGEGFTDIDKKSMATLKVVATVVVACLWGLKPDELEKRLTTSTLKMGSSTTQRRTETQSPRASTKTSFCGSASAFTPSCSSRTTTTTRRTRRTESTSSASWTCSTSILPEAPPMHGKSEQHKVEACQLSPITNR